MYERKFRGNGEARALRLRQGRRNDSERREIVDTIDAMLSTMNAPEVVDMSLRTEYDERTIFRALHIRRSQHFPYIVPELVSENGDYMLITWLTYGSLIRLLKEIQ